MASHASIHEYVLSLPFMAVITFFLQSYSEASEFILDALVLQGQDAAEGPQPLQVTRGVTNSSLWDSLKTTYLHLKRSDLASLCDDRDLNGIRTALAANYV